MELKEIEPSGKRRKLTMQLNAGGRGTVTLDGEEIKNCRGISVQTRVGAATSVTFELIGVELDIEAEVEHAYADVTDVSAQNRVAVKL